MVPAEPGNGVTCYADLPDRCYDAGADPGNVPLTINLMIPQEGDFISGNIPATLTFEPGYQFAELAIATEDDNVVEATGTIIVELLQGAGYAPLTTGNSQGQPSANPSRSLFVYDNDLTFSIDDAQVAEDKGQIGFTVRLNAPAPNDVTVNAVTVDGDATSHANVTPNSLGRDFEAKSEPITFKAGDQQKTFSVTLVDNKFQERSETFTAELNAIQPPRTRSSRSASWQPLVTVDDDSADGTIVDDEDLMVASVSRAFAMIDEGHAGPAMFMVQLTHPETVASERNPAVAWQVVDGTATAGDDYQAVGNKLTFPVGSTTGQLEVNIEDDNLLEEYLETFTVELIEQGSGFLAISPTDNSFEASIRDNEALTASITANSESVAAGQNATFTVTLVGGVSTEAVNIELEAAGTATAAEDYGTPTGSLTFPPDNTTGITATLEIPAGQSSGTLIVSSKGSPNVEEGTTVTITMSKTLDQQVSVDWATTAGDGTAEADVDYTAASGTAVVSVGSTCTAFMVSTLEDTLVEEDVVFLIRLEEASIAGTNPSELLPLGMAVALGTIQDNDTAPTTFTFTYSPNEVAEYAGATDLTVTVTLDGTTQFTVDTPVSMEMIDRPNVEKNATLGVDYTATMSNVAIPAGQSSVTATITLTPVDDNFAEGPERARLSVKSSALTDPAGKNVTISDNDDTPSEIELTVTPDSVDESTAVTRLRITAALVGEPADGYRSQPDISGRHRQCRRRLRVRHRLVDHSRRRDGRHRFPQSGSAGRQRC